MDKYHPEYNEMSLHSFDSIRKTCHYPREVCYVDDETHPGGSFPEGSGVPNIFVFSPFFFPPSFSLCREGCPIIT